MPWYDYRCDDCSHEFEASRPIAQRDEADCPKCKSRKTTRLIRTLGFFAGGSRSGGSGSSSCGPTRSGFG